MGEILPRLAAMGLMSFALAVMMFNERPDGPELPTATAHRHDLDHALTAELLPAIHTGCTHRISAAKHTNRTIHT